MALSKDDRARLIKSGKLARTALAAAHMGTRMTPHSGEDAAPSEVSSPTASPRNSVATWTPLVAGAVPARPRAFAWRL